MFFSDQKQEKKPVKIIVAGGTGWVGSALAPALVRDGHDIVVLTRSPRPPANGPRYAQWDGRSLGSWVDEVDGADAVINLAGAPVAPKRWTPARKQVLRASRIEPTHVLAQAIERATNRPRVLANASAVGYYGDRGDDVLTEEEPPGEDFLARLVVDWEAAARKAPTRVASLRIGIVLGPGGGALRQLALPFRLFAGGQIGNGRQWLPWVHIDDVIGVFRFVLNNSEIKGPINLSAPEPVRNREFARALGAVLRRPAWLPVPPIALRLALGELGGAALASTRAVPRAAQEAGYIFQQPTLTPALRQALGGPP
jgi:uncharacterized protein